MGLSLAVSYEIVLKISRLHESTVIIRSNQVTLPSAPPTLPFHVTKKFCGNTVGGTAKVTYKEHCTAFSAYSLIFDRSLNPILHTAWLDNHALTLKSNSAKYYFYEKSRFLHTFLKFCCESRKI